MHGFGKPKHSVYFLVFQWDKGISEKNHKKLVRGAIRLPIIFFRLNTMLKGKKQWMHGFGKPKHSVNLLVFRRDKGISRKSYKKLVRGAIRLPIAFLRLNTMLKGKKQRKVALIMKLAISKEPGPFKVPVKLWRVRVETILPDVRMGPKSYQIIFGTKYRYWTILGSHSVPVMASA